MVYVRRDIEEKIVEWLDEREIIGIRGPRQCGKTTLLNRIKELLIEKGIMEENIHYFDFEDDMIRLKFEENWKEFVSLYLKQGKNYFLMDEVQYIKESGKLLKLAFDSFNNIKIIITGSSSFDLTNIGKYLVGRIVFFDLLPFSFREFLRTKNNRYEKIYNEVRIDLENPKIKKTIFLDDLNKLLHEYLSYGSYPRVILAQDLKKKKEILKNIFITYIEKDVVSAYGNKYRDKVVKLLKMISSSLGGIIKYENLSQTTGLSYNDIKEIIPILQDSFVVSVVSPFHKNLSTELRKNPKIYFVDYGIRNYLLERTENIDFDGLYENFVHNQLKNSFKVNYWRTTAKTEVDFVIEPNTIPIEVKVTPKVTRALRSFVKIYDSKHAFVLNLRLVDRVDNKFFILPFVYL